MNSDELKSLAYRRQENYILQTFKELPLINTNPFSNAFFEQVKLVFNEYISTMSAWSDLIEIVCDERNNSKDSMAQGIINCGFIRKDTGEFIKTSEELYFVLGLQKPTV